MSLMRLRQNRFFLKRRLSFGALNGRRAPAHSSARVECSRYFFSPNCAEPYFTFLLCMYVYSVVSFDAALAAKYCVFQRIFSLKRTKLIFRLCFTEKGL
jgi:hypothetical protein